MTPPHRTDRRRTARRALGLVAVTASIVAAGCAPPGAAGTVVTMQTVAPAGQGQKVTANGNLQAAVQIPIVAKLSGEIATVDVADGATVKPGQQLFKVDDSLLIQQRDALSQPTSTGTKTATPKTTQPDPNKLFAPFNQLTAQRQALLQKQIASFATPFGPVDAVVGYCNGAAIPLPTPPTGEVCRDILALQEQILALSQSNAEFQFQQQAQLQSGASAGAASSLAGLSSSSSINPSTQSQIDQLDKQIDAATVRAPIAGNIAFAAVGGGAGAAAASASGSSASGTSTVRRGTLVQQGQTLMTLYDTSQVQVSANVDQSDIPGVQMGQDATVTLDAYPGKKVGGKVASIALNPTTSSSGSVTYSVGIAIAVADVPGWKPGLTAAVTILTAPTGTGLQVQDSAILKTGEGTYVYKVVDGKARKTPVQVGPSAQGYTTITSGVAEGDKVVTSGVDKLKDGESVATKDQAASA